MHHHPGSHDPILVALSILIAALSSYTALDLATRMRASSGTASLGWLAAAAVAMGGGIWAMHFVGMLAFSLPGVDVSYDPQLTLLSLAIPIVVAAGAFFVVSQRPSALIVAGVVMGLAIAGMHYTGMGAMRMPASIHYDPMWVGLSVAIAIGASIIALWLAFRMTNVIERILAAGVMGMAVSGMHYAAMHGSSFTHVDPTLSHAGHGAVGQAPLAFLIAGITIVVLVIGLTAAVYDRAAAEHAGREAAALRRSEERFRLLVEGVADHAIFALDPAGRVANWNLGVDRLLGYGEEIVGMDQSVLHTDEDRVAGLPVKLLQEAGHDGKSASEGWRVRKDGSRFWAETTLQAVQGERGNTIGFAKIIRDVSERRLAQEALERTRDALAMSQKMETVGQLTGGVAHDFNNILAVIMGSLELAKKRLPPEDTRVQRLLDNAIQGAVRGASLTQRMLAFARKQDLKPVVVDVPELVRGMAGLLKFDPGIRVETRFPIELTRVKVDANQLELAVLNLAVNARDAIAAGGGVISIAAREEPASGGLAAGRYVALSVSDTGSGMDEETLSRAQEPFFTTKGVGKGTGLGLSMVKGLAEQSGGALRLKSRVGEGTTAEIWLPVSTEKELPAQQPAEPRAPLRSGPSLSVLLVDDDALVLENIAAMLDDLGHGVTKARSGEDALELLHRAREFEIVVTDYAMPGMNGLQFAEAVAAERPGTPVVLCTGYADLLESEWPDLPRISKPFDQATLAAALDEAMRAAAAARSVVTLHPKRA